MKKTLLDCVREAVEKGKLKEPFDPEKVRKACPGFANRTYGLFLVHHRKGNPVNQPEYFERDAEGNYSFIKK